MPRILTNGVNLSYQRTGEGAPVLFMMGSSPVTLNDSDGASTWLDLFELSAKKGMDANGQAWPDLVGDRREALRGSPRPAG